MSACPPCFTCFIMNWGITAFLFAQSFRRKKSLFGQAARYFSKRFQVEFLSCLMSLLHPHPRQELESRKEEIFHLENQIKELQWRRSGQERSLNARGVLSRFRTVCSKKHLSMCFAIVLDMLRASTQLVKNHEKRYVEKSSFQAVFVAENHWPAGHLKDTESKLNAKSGEVGTISAKVEAKTEKQQVGKSCFVFLGTLSWLRNCSWVKNYVSLYHQIFDITNLRAHCLYSCRSPGGAAGGGQTHWFAGAVDGWCVLCWDAVSNPKKKITEKCQQIMAHRKGKLPGTSASRCPYCVVVLTPSSIFQFISTWSILINQSNQSQPTLQPNISTHLHRPSIHPVRWPP